jgi:hypothetical protein
MMPALPLTTTGENHQCLPGRKGMIIGQGNWEDAMKQVWIIDDDEEMIRAVELMLRLLDFQTCFSSVRARRLWNFFPVTDRICFSWTSICR